MRAGALRHKIILQSQVATKDALGQKIDTWVAIATRSASIEPLNGKEYFKSDAENAEVSTRIRLRYDSALVDLKAHDRALHGSVVYDIKSVINPREGDRELVLMCERA